MKERSESECHPVGNENNWMAGVTTGYLHQSPSQQRLDQSNTLEWGVHLFFIVVDPNVPAKVLIVPEWNGSKVHGRFIGLSRLDKDSV